MVKKNQIKIIELIELKNAMIKIFKTQFSEQAQWQNEMTMDKRVNLKRD